MRNQLLRSLPATVFHALAPHLDLERLPSRRVLSEAGRSTDRICFPESALLSVVAVSRAGGRMECALVGSEGMSGIAPVLSDDRSPHEFVVQCPGEGLFIETAHLRRVAAEHPELTETLLRYVHAFLIQIADSALSAGRARLDQRLARWLLMAQDRYGRADIPVTHEVLAALLGVRRAGVTVALNAMERSGVIGMSRGVVAVEDRAALERVAGPWYGSAEGEYRRLLGVELTAQAA